MLQNNSKKLDVCIISFLKWSEAEWNWRAEIEKRSSPTCAPEIRKKKELVMLVEDMISQLPPKCRFLGTWLVCEPETRACHCLSEPLLHHWVVIATVQCLENYKVALWFSRVFIIRTVLFAAYDFAEVSYGKEWRVWGGLRGSCRSGAVIHC